MVLVKTLKQWPLEAYIPCNTSRQDEAGFFHHHASEALYVVHAQILLEVGRSNERG